MSILVIPLFSGYLIGVHVCNFSLHTLNIYGLYIYIYTYNMYVSFPHKLSIYTSGWWFQTSFIFTPTWGKKIQFDYIIFFKMGWNHPIYTCTVYQYAAVFCFNKENRRFFFFCHFFKAQPRPHWEVRRSWCSLASKNPARFTTIDRSPGWCLKREVSFFHRKNGGRFVGNWNKRYFFLWCLCWCYCQIDILLLK